MTLLNSGDTFPTLELNLVGGETLTLPDALDGRYGVVIFNRGSWCPYCNAQLRGFERAQPQLDELGAAVVSLSVDDETATQGLINKHRLTFPVGHSADPHKVAAASGAFVNPDPAYLQATGFVLDPAGHILISVYSSGAIGRLTGEDTVGFIRHLQQNES